MPLQIPAPSEFVLAVVAKVKERFPEADTGLLTDITMDVVIRIEDNINRVVPERLFYSVVDVVDKQYTRLKDAAAGTAQEVTSVSDNGQTVAFTPKIYFSGTDQDLFSSIIPQLNVYRRMRT